MTYSIEPQEKNLYIIFSIEKFEILILTNSCLILLSLLSFFPLPHCTEINLLYIISFQNSSICITEKKQHSNPPMSCVRCKTENIRILKSLVSLFMFHQLPFIFVCLHLRNLYWSSIKARTLSFFFLFWNGKFFLLSLSS